MPVLPLDHYDWVLLRILVRTEQMLGVGAECSGIELRHVPSRRSQDGSFLNKLIHKGLLKGREPVAGEELYTKKPAIFSCRFRLTDEGRQAADTGYYKPVVWTIPNTSPELAKGYIHVKIEIKDPTKKKIIYDPTSPEQNIFGPQGRVAQGNKERIPSSRRNRNKRAAKARRSSPKKTIRTPRAKS